MMKIQMAAAIITGSSTPHIVRCHVDFEGRLASYLSLSFEDKAAVVRY